MTNWAKDAASFRDPSGFVYVEHGILYRAVASSFAPSYDHLMSSGLFEQLTGLGLLIPHDEIRRVPRGLEGAHAILQPQQVPFISYPYEWCFSQLKAAALLTLEVQRRAMSFGMALRDASAYNVQFVDGRPVLIDTLSLGLAPEGEPWPAYRQFCQHFLAPLALMALVDPSLGQLLRVHIDGVPLPLASRLMPASSRLRPGLLLHLHLHARAMRRGSNPNAAAARRRPRKAVGTTAVLGLVDSLTSAVRGLTWDPPRTLWAQYYENDCYSEKARDHKQQVVETFLKTAAVPSPLRTVWDLGANTGLYSRCAAARGARVIAFDLDHSAAERHYLDCVARRETAVLPLLQDLTNPSPSLGWRGRERRSLAERGPADLVLALALVHHLAIAANVPLPEIAGFLRSVGRWLVIEFVPKTDSQVARMFSTRDDVFPQYGEREFEQAFREYFEILGTETIADSARTVYLMKAR